MRILCIANDIPLPACSGGRVDVWRRLQALRAAGHSLALLCWFDEGRAAPPSDEVLAHLRAVCDELLIVPIRRNPTEIGKRLLNLWRWPSHVAARAVTLDWPDALAWAHQFGPDIVWLDGLYGGAVARRMSHALGKSLWYRSHNIEHRYMQAQQVRETRLARRLGLRANCFGLERFERAVMTEAVRVFDISLDDALFWRAEGFRQVEHLPTLVDAGFAARLKDCAVARDIDLLYFGNLNTPNNVEAVRWLIHAVLPLVKAAGRFVLAGSAPSESVRALLQADPRIELIENPPDMAGVIVRARVIVNPMRAGSGVNLKSVEMLFSDAVLVSTSVGVAGLPPEACICFSVQDEAEGFAVAITAGLNGEPPLLAERDAARAQFSPQALSAVLNGGNACAG